MNTLFPPPAATFSLRDYQVDLANKATDILSEHGLCYLAAEMRIGKTLIALEVARLFGAKKVAFVTKKAVVLSKTVHQDYEKLSPGYELIITNYEQVKKHDWREIDFWCVDEAHNMGAFPNPSQRAMHIKAAAKGKPMLLLSGSPSPENFTMLYPQFSLSSFSPWKHYSCFLHWAEDYVDIQLKKVSYSREVYDYTQAYKDKINRDIKPYMISFTQKEAGFKTHIKETVLRVAMKDKTYDLMDQLKENNYLKFKEGEIDVVDKPAKYMSKLLQLCSGTVKLDNGHAITLDTSKADFIAERFAGQKIAIFYNFIQELKLMQEVFGDKLTTDLDEFNQTDKWIALQIVSGREGISLRGADALVYYNLSYSAVSYWQSRDRMSYRDKILPSLCFYIFSDNGIENYVYRQVQNKKDYTAFHFRHHKHKLGKINYPEWMK